MRYLALLLLLSGCAGQQQAGQTYNNQNAARVFSAFGQTAAGLRDNIERNQYIGPYNPGPPSYTCVAYYGGRCQ